MSSWDKKALIDLAFYYNGYAFKPTDWKDQGVKIVRIEQLNNPRGNADYFTGTVPDYNRIDNGDLIFSWSATLKVVIWRHGKGVLNQHLFKVVPKEGVDKEYLYYVLDHNMEELGGNSQGSTMKHVKRSDLEKFVVSVPPLPIQQRITKILRVISGQIEKTEAIIAKYKAIKQGLMQDLFTRGIDVATGKLRPRYQDAPELYKSSPLGMIPKEWTPCELNEIFEKLLNGGTPPTNIPHYWQGNIPWVTGADFLESYEIGEIRRYVSPQAAKETSTNIIPKGNILLVTRTGVGKLAIAPTDIAISQDITGIILDSDKVSAEYFYYYLQVIVEDFKKLNQGTSINGIIRDDLVSYETAYPKQDEQNKITEILQSNDKLLKDEQYNLSKLNLLKKGLMSDLLSGKVRVKVDEEAVC